MYNTVATYEGDLSAIGFGDELQIDYDPGNGNLRISVFKNYHWKDDVVLCLPKLFTDGKE